MQEQNAEFGRMPKIIIVAPRLDIGGTEIHICRVVSALRRHGIDVSLFVLDRGGILESTLTDAGVHIAGPKNVRSKSHRALREGWDLYRHLRRERPDIVHFFLAESYLVGSFAAMFAGIKVRVMSRRSLANYQIRHPFLALVETRLHRRTHVLLGNSKAVVGELAKECGDRAKIGLIYNGIDCPPAISEAERAIFRRELGLSDECFVLTIVANLIGYKGHQDLLQGLALLRDQLPSGWRLLVVGRDDGIGASLKRQADDLGLAGHIQWFGERKDVYKFFSVADVALLVSHEEGFSNSLIEAMSHGLPVVATAIGGNLDAVIDKQTGLLVPIKAPQAIADAVIKLAADPQLRSRLGAAARRRVITLFSLEGCVQRYANLYRGISSSKYVAAQAVIEPSANSLRFEQLTRKSRAPRILHVIPDLGVGGAEAMLAQLLSLKSLRANETMVVTFVPGGFYADKLRAAGITVVELDCRKLPGIVWSFFRLTNLISTFKADIVQGWMYYGDLAALLALHLSLQRRKTYLIWTIRCSDMELSYYRLRLRLAVRLCTVLSSLPDLVMANSNAGIKAHLRLGYRPRRVHVIANGVDVERFKPDAAARTAVRKELHIPANDILLIHVARLDPMKDHQNFISAIAELPGCHALLIGSGTEQLSGEPNVHCLGLQTDMPRFYAAADFVVSSSAFGEGFSNVIAEAMACGLPAVATDVGDAALILGDTGLVVPPRNPKALAEAVLTLVAEAPEIRAKRAASARARVVENFSLELAGEHFASVYNAL